MKTEKVEFVNEKELISEGYKKVTQHLYIKKSMLGLDCFVKCGDCQRLVGITRVEKNQSKGLIICRYCGSTTEFVIPQERKISSKTGVSY